MNRYKLHEPKPPIQYPTIETGQIWRGKHCDANPMLIEIGKQRADGNWRVMQADIDPHEVRQVYHRSGEEISLTYVIDQWGGK